MQLDGRGLSRALWEPLRQLLPAQCPLSPSATSWHQERTVVQLLVLGSVCWLPEALSCCSRVGGALLHVAHPMAPH